MFRDFKKYEIFLDGRVWSYKRNKWLKPTLRPDGYLRVTLSDNDNNVKSYYLHRIIYEAVTGQPIPEDKEVNHIDENKNNNAFSNLNLLTRKENVNWGTGIERCAKARINHLVLSKQVEQYDKDGNLINVWPSTIEVQRQLGFNCGHISQCCNGKRKSANGFIWKYVS